MSNYFTTRSELASKKTELLSALAEIYEIEDSAYCDYLRELQTIITKHPDLTAAQYAAILGKSKEERESIRISIGVMGHMTEASRKHRTTRGGQPICEYPSMPHLSRKQKTITRHFIEVDENGTPLGTLETSETKLTYSITK